MRDRSGKGNVNLSGRASNANAQVVETIHVSELRDGQAETN